MSRLVLLALALATRMAGQSATPVRLTVTPDKTNYYLGETIQLQLQYTSTEPKTFAADSQTYDRIGRQNGVEVYEMDPVAGTEDPLQGLVASMGGMGGISGGPVILSEKPFVIERTLNEWIRFTRPGTYRLHVVSHRVSRLTHPGEKPNILLLQQLGEIPPVTVTSDSITLVIHPAPAKWVSEQISAATAFIDGPVSQTGADAEARTKAIRTLRFLNTHESTAQLAWRMENGSGVTYWYLSDTSYRPEVLAILEKRLVAPAESINENFLQGLAEIAAPREESQRRVKLREEKLDLYTKRLLDALPGKQPPARTACLAGLLDALHRVGHHPDGLDKLTAEIVAEFPTFPPSTQAALLARHWPILNRPAMQPVLRDIYNNPATGSPLRDAALRDLYDLDPAEGRRLIMDEIRHHPHRIGFETLAMLPDKTLPEADEDLAANYEQNIPDADLLIIRYGTGAISSRVKKEYTQRKAAFKPTGPLDPIIYYLLKYDPAFAEKEMRRSLASPGGPPAQYDIAFQFYRLDRWAMSPALEHLAIELLSSPSVAVKKGAAEILGKYGSPYAKDPLWHAMEFFHSWWQGREEELKGQPYREGPQLEQALAMALATADGWVLTEPEWTKLDQLCISKQCRSQVQNVHAQAITPVAVWAHGWAFPINLGNFSIRSDEQLHRKLSQYPAGTAFRFEPQVAGYEPPPEQKQFREQIARAIRAGGHQVVGLH